MDLGKHCRIMSVVNACIGMKIQGQGERGMSERSTTLLTTCIHVRLEQALVLV